MEESGVGAMKAQLSPESRAAMDAHSTLRCLYKMKYNGSRGSQEVIARAQEVAEEINFALGAALGQEFVGLTAQLNSIVLSRNWAFVCFDVYIEGCSPEILAEVDSSCERPIHYIQKKGDTFFVRREPTMDTYVAKRYSHMKNVDLGPLPYFMDESNPPVYDNGLRLEAPAD